MMNSKLSFRRHLKSQLTLLVCFLLFPQGLAGQEHSPDHGSTDLADSALSIFTNATAGILEGLPENFRKRYLENLEQDFLEIQSDAERGNKLLSLAGKLLSNNFPKRAERLYRALASDTRFSPQVRAKAWTKAGLIAPVYGLRDDSADCFRRSVVLIDSIPETDRTWIDSYVQLDALSWLAHSLYCNDMDSPELPIVYRRILEFEPEFGDTDAKMFLTLGLDASRVMRQRNDPEEASIYLRLAEKYVHKNKNLSLGARISILFETTGGLYKWNDPSRIEKLKEMWDEPKNQKQPEVMRVGNEILWAMFLDRKADKGKLAQFEEFAEEFNKRGTELLKTVDESKSDNISIFTSQGTAVLAVSKHEGRDDSDIEELRDQFKELRNGQPVVGRFPGQATREETRTMADAFYMAVTELFEIDLNKPVPAKSDRDR